MKKPLCLIFRFSVERRNEINLISENTETPISVRARDFSKIKKNGERVTVPVGA